MFPSRRAEFRRRCHNWTYPGGDDRSPRDRPPPRRRSSWLGRRPRRLPTRRLGVHKPRSLLANSGGRRTSRRSRFSRRHRRGRPPHRCRISGRRSHSRRSVRDPRKNRRHTGRRKGCMGCTAPRGTSAWPHTGPRRNRSSRPPHIEEPGTSAPTVAYCNETRPRSPNPLRRRSPNTAKPAEFAPQDRDRRLPAEHSPGPSSGGPQGAEG